MKEIKDGRGGWEEGGMGKGREGRAGALLTSPELRGEEGSEKGKENGRREGILGGSRGGAETSVS